MPTHYLLTPASRGMGLSTLMRMSDQEIYHLFCQARWPDTAGLPVCPTCDKPARGPDGRGRYHCKGCLGRFTLTSGTALHGLKLSRRALLLAIFSWVTAVKGISALQLSRLLDIQYGTAFSLCHKLRHALARECAGRQIGGPGRVVAVDGVYIGGHVRPANWRENRRDRVRLGVESQDVVTGQAESADGCLCFQATMGPMPVVAVQPQRQLVGTAG